MRHVCASEQLAFAAAEIAHGWIRELPMRAEETVNFGEKWPELAKKGARLVHAATRLVEKNERRTEEPVELFDYLADGRRVRCKALQEVLPSAARLACKDF
jgi:hypothetical protein